MKRSMLIVDDMEINRVILAGIFKDEYDIIEADNGEQALAYINNESIDIAAVLLDLIMPVIDGIGVLKEMNNNGKIARIPVFIITASDSEKILLDAYNLGAIDVIYKPFNTNFIKLRIENVVELYRHRNDLEKIINEQVKRLRSVNQSMVETLATIIEFRACETGEHVRNICDITEILITNLSRRYPEYYLDISEISKIVSAAILHDVGKIAIPDNILNKPGRLTKDELEIMKQHTIKGCDILSRIPNLMDHETYYYCCDICRHHHERWDGKGYPDGLKGDEITIWAQAVSIADVYDALVSPRVHKASFSSEKALRMINAEECGVFNPKLLQVFNDSIEEIRAVYKINSK